MKHSGVISFLTWCVVLLSSSSKTARADTAAGVAAMKGMDWRYFVAGGVCAATSHGITTPIDVVKTRMQAEPEVYDKGISDATMKILKADGPGALLGGLAPTVVGYGIEGAMKFGVYEVTKPLMAKLLANLLATKNTAAAFIASSVLAGAVASVFLCPMESARIRVVTDEEYKDKSLASTLIQLIKTDGGVGGLFSGIYAMLSKQVPYTMAKQVSFDIVAGLLYNFLAGAGKSVEDLKWAVSVVSAFVASLFACIFSQPGDMILTETYKNSSQKGFWGVVNSIYEKNNSISGFFTGTGARILHVSTIITSQLVIYDIVKQFLGLPATGSH